MSSAAIQPPDEVYRKAVDDCQRQLQDLLRQLPEAETNDLIELFELHAKAVANDDDEARDSIAQAIREILFPESLKVQLEKGFFEDDQQVRARLDFYRERVGMEIRKRRESLKMTQADLADKAGIPQSHVSRLECGKHVPTHITIEKIATALGTIPSQLDPGFND